MSEIKMSAQGDGDTTTNDSSVTDKHGYFESYTNLKVHEVMLRDWPRNSAYRRFFEENSNLVRDKVVMDVGAGTGILSLFAASVGARKVYAVEASDTAHLCRQIVEDNGFADKIEVVHSAVEDIDLKGLKVDVIVSEWMGFYLLHESMLDSVQVARDRFLAEDGIMVPSVARMYLAPVNMETFLEEKYEFWHNVCGFDFSAAVPHLQRQLLQEPLTTELSDGQVKAPPQILREFDLKTVTLSEVQAFSQTVSFDVPSPTCVHGFVLWFDVDFRQGLNVTNPHSQSLRNSRTENCAAGANKCVQPSETDNCTAPSGLEKRASPSGSDKYVPPSEAGNCAPPSRASNWKVVPEGVLSTSPASPVTHWKQTVIILPSAISVVPSEPLTCKVVMIQSSDNKRHYNIELELVDDNDDDDDDDEESDDEEHLVPCECGRGKCQLIKTLMEKYGEEQDALEAEAEIVDLTAEVQAAEAIDVEMDEDMNNSDQV